MGSYQTVELIDTFINYQESIKRCVCIVFDPQLFNSGALALKAVRLRDQFVELHKGGNITTDKLKALNISSRDIFEEIPITVHNSALGKAMIAAFEPEDAISRSGSDRLNLTAASSLERNLAFLNDCLEDIVTEQQKVPALKLGRLYVQLFKLGKHLITSSRFHCNHIEWLLACQLAVHSK